MPHKLHVRVGRPGHGADFFKKYAMSNTVLDGPTIEPDSSWINTLLTVQSTPLG